MLLTDFALALVSAVVFASCHGVVEEVANEVHTPKAHEHETCKSTCGICHAIEIFKFA